MKLRHGLRLVHDAARDIWVSAAAVDGFAYSDGDAAENAILTAIEAVNDPRVGSDEIQASIHDFVTRYHLSGNRANLLRPLRGLLGGRVLEVGAGCGAITRHLGESGAQVLALEGSPRRAGICRARCRGLANVEVLCVDAAREFPAGPFDAVLLIGVLEYAGRYGDAADPYRDLLERCRSALAKGGVLVLAIENRTGLKYFAGAPEDHLGVPFAGVHDTYEDRGPRTFGRIELRDLLQGAGFTRQEFLFPFPDYKFPRVVVSAAALERPDHAVIDMIGGLAADDQAQSYSRSFSEESAWPSLLRNGLGGDLANSFLVIAGGVAAPAAPTALAYCYALDWRRCFHKETVLGRDGSGALSLRRERLYPNEAPPAGVYAHRLEGRPFVAGDLLGAAIYDIVNRPGWTLDHIVDWARPWVEYLETHSTPAASGALADRRLPADLLDCTPFNLLVASGGERVAFDQEWVADRPQSLGYIVFRGLLSSLVRIRSTAMPVVALAPTLGEVITGVASRLGVTWDAATLAGHAASECRLQEFVTGRASDPQRLLALAPPPQRGRAAALQVPVPDPAQAAEIERLNAELNSAADAVKVLGEKFDARGAEVVHLQSAAHAAGVERDAALAESDAHRREVEVATARAAQLTTEKDAAAADAARATADAARAAAEAARAAADLETLRARERELAGRIDTLKVERETLSQQVWNLDRDVHRKSQDIARHKEQMARAEHARLEVVKERDAMRTRLVALTAELGGQVEKLRQSQSLVAELVAANQTLLASHAHELEVAASFEAQLEQKQTQLMEMSDWATRMRDQLEQMAREVEAVTHSESWRLTRPLRELGILARNPRRVFQTGPVRRMRNLLAPFRLGRSAGRLLKGLGGGPGSKRAEANALGAQDRAAAPGNTLDIFMWGVIDWHFRIQRPQHIARELARLGHRVHYVSSQFVDSTEPGYTVESIPIAGSDREVAIVRLKVPHAPLIYFAAATAGIEARLKADVGLLLADLGTTRPVNIVQHPFWLPVVTAMPNQQMVYDCMDNHAGFGNNSADILALEAKLAQQADLVIATSTWIEEESRARNPHVATIRNGCEPDHFCTRPERIYRDPKSRPIIGYYGAIAEWFDVELILRLAAEFQDALVLLVGADTANVAAATKGHDNIVMTGEVPYGELPYYLHAFDVCILPFRVNELTLATNPVKAYEYLSAGKAVVAVDLPEMGQFENLVARAGTHDAFVDHVRDALARPASAAVVRRRIEFGRENSWQERARAVETAALALTPPLVSIIIVTYNNREMTEACFASIEATRDYSSYEVIVVDNASHDDSPAFIREFCRTRPHWRCILNTENGGFSAGNNQGLVAARGEYLVLLNNDTVVTRGWLGTLVGHLERDPGIALIGPVTNNIGNEARIDTRYTDVADMHAEARAWTLAHMGQSRDMNTLAFFCVMMPRRVYERIGPLDEAFGIGMFEDDDYCRRIQRESWRIVCADDVFIHHHLSASLNLLGQKRRDELFETNKKIYEAKWGKWIAHVYRD